MFFLVLSTMICTLQHVTALMVPVRRQVTAAESTNLSTSDSNAAKPLP